MSNTKPDTEPHSCADCQSNGEPDAATDRKPHRFPDTKPHATSGRLCGQFICRMESVF